MLFWRSRSLKWPDFPCPWSQAYWHYAAELRTLSFTYPLCGLVLTNTTDNPSETCPLKLRLLPVFVPMIINNLTSCHDQGLELATPRWESQDSNHAATPTYFKNQWITLGSSYKVVNQSYRNDSNLFFISHVLKFWLLSHQKSKFRNEQFFWGHFLHPVVLSVRFILKPQ